jgi:hypothetical protein
LEDDNEISAFSTESKPASVQRILTCSYSYFPNINWKSLNKHHPSLGWRLTTMPWDPGKEVETL